MRRLAALLVATVASLAVATPALANLCQQKYIQNFPASTWDYTIYSYTDYSEWDAAHAYDAARFSTSGITWTQWQSSGGFLSFDNGTYSPYRKTGMRNNGTVQTMYWAQYNFNGAC